MKNCLVYAVYTDVGRSLSSRPSPDFYIGDLPDRRLPAPRFPMKVNFQRGGITDSSSRNAVSFSSARTTNRFAAVAVIVVSIVPSIGGYKPPFPIPEMQSAFHRLAQRNAFHHRGVRW